MEIKQTLLEGDILKITLKGLLDIQGAAEVELPFSVASGKYDKIIIDFSNVDFLASIGIRILVKTFKTLSQRGGRLVIFQPNETTLQVLKTTGIDGFLIIVEDEKEAIEAIG